jgi:ribosomal protein L40E
MARFPEAEARMFRNRFVCRKCKTVMRASNMKVLAMKITCRNCGSHAFKPKRKR